MKKIIALVLLALFAASCGGSPPNPTTTTTTTSTVTVPSTTSTTTTTTSSTTSTTTTTTTSPSTTGWRTVWTENFNTAVQQGQFPGPAYSSKIGVYPVNSPDTSANIEGSNSGYDPRIISVADGILTKRLQITASGPRAATIVPLLPGTPAYNPNQNGGWPNINGTTTALREGRYSIRWRIPEAVPGWKIAWLLWPETEAFPRDGEVDFPEGDFDGQIFAFMHRQNAVVGSDQDAFSTGVPVAGAWHTTVIERTTESIRFFLNGQLIGVSTSRLPVQNMTWRVQTETCFWSCQPTSNAVVEIDWMTVEVPS